MKKRSILTLFSLGLLLTSCSPSKTYNVNDYRTSMNFHDDFKILQLTDLHFGIETNIQKQLDFISSSIQKEDPDLIILTGDNFMYSSKKLVRTLISNLNENCKTLTQSHPDRITKFAITYGNHDNQGDYPRYYINDVVSKYSTNVNKEIEESKYAAFIDYEDDELNGLTNYFIDLVDDVNKDETTVDVKYRIHVIDSNTYHFTGIKYGYDVIHEDQLEHAKNIYETSTKDKDYIGLGVFHIPLEEFQEGKNQYEDSSSNNGQGIFLENVLYPYTNNDSYKKLKEANISAFIVGHNHKINSDVIYNESSDNIDDKAIFSFGVKSTDQLYHSQDLIGYKTIILKDNMTKEEFISIDYINENFTNVTNRYQDYEK